MKQAWYTKRNEMSRKHRNLSFYNIIPLILLLLVLFITGLQLNLLSTQLLISDIKGRGNNYDSFREMKLSVENIKKSQKRMDDLCKKYPSLKRAQGVNSIAYLTFNMLAKDFDLEEEKLIDETVFIKAIPKLIQSSGYQKLYGYYKAVLNDIQYFPVPRLEGDEEDISYVDTWNELRRYGGKRRHEGTDIMAINNKRGYYPILSITDGVIEKLGWLEQGGYRVGIRSPSGGYFYYAHLSSYADGIKKGDKVIAGQLLGFMGDSGYGKEGTVGQFEVHLHLGIYVDTESKELSVNPYHILQLLESRRLSCPKMED